MPGVFLSEKEDFVSFEYCDDFDLKTQLFKPKDITHNGLRLPEGGDLEALHCQPSTNFDRSTKLDLTTEPPLLGSCC
jgi:hypothetical protein